MAALALYAAALPDVVVLCSGRGALVRRHRATDAGCCRTVQGRDIRIGIEYAGSQQPRNRAWNATNLFRSFRAHLCRDSGFSPA